MILTMVTKENNQEKKVIRFSDIRKEWWKISRTNWKARQYFLIYLIIFGIFLWVWLLDRLLCYIIWIEWDSLIPDIFYNILSQIFALWTLAFSFALIRWIDAKVGTFWNSLTRDRIWKWVLWMILYWTFIGIWFIFLIIPWIILSVRLRFLLCAVIDKEMDPLEAIKYSWNITKWHFREIVRFDIYFWFFNLLWMLCLFIWLVWTIPMTQLAMVRYYMSLCELYESQPKIENKDMK